MPLDIEVYFKILKSGCKVEELQLETAERSAPCDIIFHEAEWKSVYVVKNKCLPPEKPPSLAEMIKMIASLGGFLNRKRDGYLGPKVMWIGMQKMRNFAIAWELSTQLNGGTTYG